MSSMNMFSTLGGRLKLDRALVSHGLRLAFASWLAFVIAVMLHVNNPYWAAMPAWVVTQATRGLMLERGFFRLLGTLVGAAFGLLLLHQVSSVPAQLLLLGLWITACTSLTHVLKGVHAYGLLLCGITGTVVVLPSLVEPGHTLDLAVARIECTLIGVVIATLVTSWFTPWSERQAFYRRVRLLAGDAVDFAGAALRGEAADELERRLLAQIGEMEGSANSPDTCAAPRRAGSLIRSGACSSTPRFRMTSAWPGPSSS